MTSNIKSTNTLQIKEIDNEIETSILSDSSQKSVHEEEEVVRPILRVVNQKMIWTSLENLFDLNLLQFMGRQGDVESLLVLMIRGLEGRSQHTHKLIPDDSKVKFEMEKISLLFGEMPTFLQETTAPSEDHNPLLHILTSFESKLHQKTPLGLLHSEITNPKEPLSDCFQTKLRRVFGLILKKRLPIIEQISEGNQVGHVVETRLQGRISKVYSNSNAAFGQSFSKYDCSSMIGFFNFWRIYLFVENEELVLDDFAKIFMSSIFANLVKHEKFQLEKHFKTVLEFFEGSGNWG